MIVWQDLTLLSAKEQTIQSKLAEFQEIVHISYIKWRIQRLKG